MQNRDRLEEFIKTEVNSIEFDDADSSWEEFQVRLEKVNSKSKKGFWYWTGILFAIFFIAFIGFYLDSLFNQPKISEEKEDLEIPVKKERKPMSNEASSLKIESQKNSPFEIKEKNSNSVENNASPVFKNTIGLNPVAISSGTTKVVLEEKLDDEILSQKKQNIPLPVIIDSTLLQKEIDQKKLTPTAFEKIIAWRHSDKSFKLLGSISMIESKPLLIQDEETTFPFVSIERVPRSSNVKNFYISLENSFANNNIHQLALGFGKYFPLKNNFGINVQAGGSLDKGYSFSQDSVFIINGLSIEERRKNKDLKNIWNAYLDLGFFYKKNKWRLGIGFRGSYALFNRFYIEERIVIQHSGAFNNLVGTVEGKREKSTWNGINRVSSDGYLNVTYHAGPNYSIGLFAVKRLNKLIKKDLANQAYSNTPLRLGIVVNKHF